MGDARREPGPGRIFAILAFASLVAPLLAQAQELEPRAYSPAPVGTNFFAVAVGASRGAVLLDPTIPVTDVRARLDQATLGYARTFAFGSRPGLVSFGIPYVWGDVDGNVQEQARQIHRSGLADVRVKMSVNFVGPKAMSPAEFATAPRRTIVGASLTVQAPTGEYDETKLINLGTNRWAFKPEVGVSVPVGQWYLDVYGGVWLFTTNDQFYPGGATRSQDPLTTLQAHASYTFKSRAWLAADATWYGGGAVAIDDSPPTARQNNTRFGGTFSTPITKRQSLKIAISGGASARAGTDFQTYVVGWQLMWFDRPRASES